MSLHTRFNSAITTRRLLAASALVAGIATAGSLFYSLGLGLFPCRLCWYQRILMYPLTAVLGWAAIRNVPRVAEVVLPLSLLGTGIAAYHTYIQLAPASSCGTLACSTIQLRLFGILSIPNQSLLAFTYISILTGTVLYRTRAS